MQVVQEAHLRDKAICAPHTKTVSRLLDTDYVCTVSCSRTRSAPVQMISKKSSGQKGLLNTHSTLMAFDICTLCMAICNKDTWLQHQVNEVASTGTAATLFHGSRSLRASSWEEQVRTGCRPTRAL